MKTQSMDTNPKAEEVWISLLRQKNAAQKFAIVRSLSELTIKLSKRAIKRVNKDLSDSQVDELFIAHHYGEDLAKQVRAYRKMKTS